VHRKSAWVSQVFRDVSSKATTEKLWPSNHRKVWKVSLSNCPHAAEPASATFLLQMSWLKSAAFRAVKDRLKTKVVSLALSLTPEKGGVESPT